MYDYENHYAGEEYQGYQMPITSDWSTQYTNESGAKDQPKGSQKERKGFKKVAMSVGLGLCFGIFAGAGFYGVQTGIGLLHPEQETKVTAETPVNNTLFRSDSGAVAKTNITMVESDVSDMVEVVMPSMVSITNTTTAEMNFFGQRYTQDTPYSGSGIIVGETQDELLIVTNYHVIENANKLEVTFIEDSKAEAQVKGTDEDMDLAVISVPLKNLEQSTLDAVSVAQLGNSENLKLGEPVIAIGNALGYGQSVTNGIVSALNREIEVEEGKTGTYIQTNAAINGGNSGGALLNMNGEVIGINSAKIGGSSVEGMGYAIPISSANPIIADLMERQTRNKVDQDKIGYMGISLQEVNSTIAKTYQMPVGIYVVATEENSAAAQAGILSGDIITKLDGQKVSSYEGLQKTLQYYAAGDTTKITVMRQENGQYVEHELEITFGQRPKSAR